MFLYTHYSRSYYSDVANSKTVYEKKIIRIRLKIFSARKNVILSRILRKDIPN